MEKIVREFIQENNLIEAGQTVGVAVSGGPDSMALLSCLCLLAPSAFFSVVCVHFEHGIRGQESLDDADFVSQYCAEHNIPFYMSAADVPSLAEEWHVGKQSAAKRAREEYFKSLTENGDVDVIATAHHLDDNAESVLMHILRGSGTDGLRGIHPKNAEIIRPLLCVNRQEILAYLEEKGIGYVTDKTNEENEYTRNFIRNVLMPQLRERINPDVAGALNRLSVIAEYDAKYIGDMAQRDFAQCAKVLNDSVEIDIGMFGRLSEAIRCRIVRLACEKLYITQDVQNVHVLSVLALADKNRTGSRVNLSNNLYAAVEYGKLLIGFSARESDVSFCMPFDFEATNELPDGSTVAIGDVYECDYENSDPNIAYVDADKLPGALMLRTRYHGDMIHPLGAPGKKKLKDYFIDKKLPRGERDKTPLLADGSRIVWAAGHVIDDECRVTDDTTRIYCLKYMKKREDA
ncbi:MAG: tRNA lysidine(34) synthetase TilS [Christensenella sp.]|uniref:tRNA lysidine(34) synthetase TilS n=1 Tax=Christensenella sp. TaxID=1935934 RepID=UPI002B1F04B3|nr:tRNA lysidine(34) synthetase TilS [Christensenella sp.]MEA5002610.1 tRNA lysidine(34) synthetase TilS [Christensenella sp.]